MASNSFDLLDLADGESGDAAVSVVVGKITEADAAKLANAADPAAHDEKPKYFSFYTKLQHDSGVRICRQELRKLRQALGKLRGQETIGESNEGRLKELSDEEEKLKQEEARLVRQRKAFYNEYGIPSEEEKFSYIFHGANADTASSN